jgi:hypothetical protein
MTSSIIAILGLAFFVLGGAAIVLARTALGAFWGGGFFGLGMLLTAFGALFHWVI